MEKIKIGRVSGAQGLRGEIKIYHDSGDEAAIRRITSLFLFDESYTIENLRMHKRTPIIKLEGIEDRGAAEALIGAEVYALLGESRPTGEGEWLVSELVGLEVRFLVGEERGEVAGIISNPAHDILEIKTSSGTRLLPLIDIFVLEIDPESGYILVSPPSGWSD